MSSPILILAGTGILTGAAIAILTVLIIGIRRGDRRHLARTPESHSDALARRILVGVRYPGENSEGENR